MLHYDPVFIIRSRISEFYSFELDESLWLHLVNKFTVHQFFLSAFLQEVNPCGWIRWNGEMASLVSSIPCS